MGRISPSSRHPGRASKFLIVLLGGFFLGAFAEWMLMDTFHSFKQIGMDNDDDDQERQQEGAKGDILYPIDAQTTSNAGAIEKSSASTLTKADAALFPSTGDTIHVLLTSGGGSYQNFQSRMMYSTYHMVRKLPEGQKLIAFTRILHRVKTDALMEEIPTFHAKPLQPECDVWCAFPPALRPDAVRQFFDAAKKTPSMIQAPWLFMTECDYVWIKPVTAPRAEDMAAKSIAFLFTYIVATNPEFADVIERLHPGRPSSEIPATGPAPALMRVHEWLSITPHWERITADMEEYEDAKEKLGWVREMYAFSIACALENVTLDLQLPPNSPLMIQPPADHGMGDAAIMHYTWSSIISDKDGKEVWRFEKREYTDDKWEKNPEELPEVPLYDADAGWKLQDGVVVTSNLRDTLSMMIKTMNEAIKKLQPLAST
ncbi:hypothetical protein Ndes2526B_g05130 [Nannochloris sp. 'desiccata']|nr:hypothetical protein KSW81_000061 [Chlorella desiccata (nom. nud.)]KAH7619885.1 putative Hydroxyproline O-arabinosyltransferase PLENTY [Chlorella desiccata (nom. nud.)]